MSVKVIAIGVGLFVTVLPCVNWGVFAWEVLSRMRNLVLLLDSLPSIPFSTSLLCSPYSFYLLFSPSSYMTPYWMYCDSGDCQLLYHTWSCELSNSCWTVNCIGWYIYWWFRCGDTSNRCRKNLKWRIWFWAMLVRLYMSGIPQTSSYTITP